MVGFPTTLGVRPWRGSQPLVLITTPMSSLWTELDSPSSGTDPFTDETFHWFPRDGETEFV